MYTYYINAVVMGFDTYNLTETLHPVAHVASM